jgi:periplasmic divalent cation tolerance protein
VNANDPCEVVVTAPEHDWLCDLCRQLVEAHLASSAHVVFPVESIYRWRGAVHQATEGRAFLRTRFGHVDALVAFVLERHPYEVPNVTVLPIVGGNPAYLSWIEHETADSQK